SIEARGKPGGVACRPLVRALSLQRPRGVSGLPAAFVGRETELGRLQQAYEQVVAERTPRFQLILGDPGVGKTRLVRELWQWLAVLQHLLETVRGPLLLIGTARPELHERRPGFGAAEKISLEPLPADASERLLAELLGAGAPPQLLPVVAAAEGNPFFVEEV